MLEEILDWIYILGAAGGFLLFIWKLSAKIERKKNQIDETDRTIETRLSDLETRIGNLEESNRQAATKRVEKSENTGKLLQELLEKIGDGK